MAPIIHWFRNDLRLHDNTALAAAAAASGNAVIPLFILDDRLLTGPSSSPARVRFLLESLHALDAALRSLGSRLLVRRGDPLRELLELARQSGAAGVYWNRDYSPYAVRRDTAIKEALRAAGYTTRSFKDAVLWECNEILNNEGKPYTVYTPYARRWRQQIAATSIPLAPVPDLHPLPEVLETLPIPDLAELGMHTQQITIPGGEAQGRQLLEQFVDLQRAYSIASYKDARDLPALPATSRLSAHLRMGTISPRTCVHAALELLAQATAPSDRLQSGVDTWIGELIWRDFYVQILYHFPYVLRGAFKPQFNAIEWENNPEYFAAWQAGHTGYPIVDAAMRQLQAEAWMHNRARMIVASFLSKDLLIDWRWGERYFMQQLIDGNPAANNGGWQWAAGTGTDAQPYFRIFNPISQGQKFDAQGAYVRRYLPELAHVPDSFIHEPWKMSTTLQQQCGLRIGRDYPAPIVDHAIQRQRALALYDRVKRHA